MFPSVSSMQLAKHQTEVRLLHDRDNLYISYKCYEPDLAKLKVDATERDGNVFGDDCVELFLDPINTQQSRAEKKYFHIIINSRGVVDDRAGGYVRGDKTSWSPDYPVGSGKGDGYWSLELALPFKALSQSSEPNNVWRVNFNRARRTDPQEYSCWAPTFARSHNQTKWGHLEFE